MNFRTLITVALTVAAAFASTPAVAGLGRDDSITMYACQNSLADIKAVARMSAGGRSFGITVNDLDIQAYSSAYTGVSTARVGATGFMPVITLTRDVASGFAVHYEGQWYGIEPTYDENHKLVRVAFGPTKTYSEGGHGITFTGVAGAKSSSAEVTMTCTQVAGSASAQ